MKTQVVLSRQVEPGFGLYFLMVMMILFSDDILLTLNEYSVGCGLLRLENSLSRGTVQMFSATKHILDKINN